MNFLIIAPKYKNTCRDYYEFPLGLAYISASLKKAGHDVTCLNLNHYKEPIEKLLDNAITSKDIDIVCTGGLSIHFSKIRDIVDISRKVKRDVITIIGGGLVSSEPDLIMNSINADFGVIGEGEETIIELASAIENSDDFNQVKGIIYRGPATIISTEPRAPIADINLIARPDYEGFEVNKYLDMQLPNDEFYMYAYNNPRVLPIISSRSCPFSCTFCYHPLSKKYRQRSLENFFSEIEYLIDRYQCNTFAILDELFSMKNARIQEFCKRIQKYNVKWLAQLRVDSIDEETLHMMKLAGCICISYGLESAASNVLKSMKKMIKPEDIERTLDLTYKTGIGIQGNFIFGDKAENWKLANETLKWWLDHKKYQITLGVIFAYPGTELYHYALSKGIIKDKLKYIENGCPSLNWSKMSKAEYAALNTLIYEYTIENMMQAEIISIKAIGHHSHKGKLHEITVKCPHCSRKTTYGNLHDNGFSYYGLIPALHCRICNQRFSLPFAFDLQIIDRINSIIAEGGTKIATWGASQFTRLLFSYVPSLKENVVCVFDNDANKHGISFDGVKVVPFPANPENLKTSVEEILITSKDFEDDIYKQISYLDNYGIKIHKLYSAQPNTKEPKAREPVA